MEKFKKLSKVEMKNVMGGGLCGCLTVYCENEFLDISGEVQVVNANCSSDLCVNYFAPDTIVVGCECTPGQCS